MTAREPVTPDQLRTFLQRKFLISAAGIVTDPAGAAAVAMDVVTPVLEDRDARIARLEARVAELEALAGDMVGRYEPHPGWDTWYRAKAAADQVARWRAVLGGEGE